MTCLQVLPSIKQNNICTITATVTVTKSVFNGFLFSLRVSPQRLLEYSSISFHTKLSIFWNSQAHFLVLFLFFFPSGISTLSFYYQKFASVHSLTSPPARRSWVHTYSKVSKERSDRSGPKLCPPGPVHKLQGRVYGFHFGCLTGFSLLQGFQIHFPHG